MSFSSHEMLQPPGWPSPKGYSNGIAARGTMVFVAGQIGWDETGTIVGADLVTQAGQALQNVVAVLAEAGAEPTHIVRMTWYVTDLAGYRDGQRQLGQIYRQIMGQRYPAMTLVEVKSLVEPGAVVEIEATAVIPDESDGLVDMIS